MQSASEHETSAANHSTQTSTEYRYILKYKIPQARLQKIDTITRQRAKAKDNVQQYLD